MQLKNWGPKPADMSFSINPLWEYRRYPEDLRFSRDEKDCAVSLEHFRELNLKLDCAGRSPDKLTPG
jgi:hypothetical protein